MLLGWTLTSGVVAFAQTKVDLQTQSKSIDFSSASSTKPLRAGSNLPATCSVGELFFETGASPGLNIYLCAAVNVWTGAGVTGFSQLSGTAAVAQLPATVQYFQSGVGAPAGACMAGQNTYLDTSNLDYWFCDAANTWKKLLSTSDNGPFTLTGQLGTTPATPASGLATVYLNSTDETLHTVSDAGIDMRYAGLGESNAWGPFLQDFSGSSIKLPMAAGFTTTTNGGIGYDTTASQVHVSVNATDAIIPTRSTSAPTIGNCVKWGPNGQLQDQGGSCGGATTASFTITTEGTTGVGTNQLAKLSGAPSTAVKTATTDTSGAVGICTSACGAGVTATISYAGVVGCVFDGATTAGDYVQISSTVAGECHDSALATYPTSGQVMGRVLSTNGAGGTFNIDLFPAEIKAVSGGGGAPATVTLLSKTSNYASLPGDFSGTSTPPTLVKYTLSGGGVAHTLPSTAPALVNGNMPCEVVSLTSSSWPFVLQILTGGSTTLDGTAYAAAPGYFLSPGQSVEICSNGTNYIAVGGGIVQPSAAMAWAPLGVGYTTASGGGALINAATNQGFINSFHVDHIIAAAFFDTAIQVAGSAGQGMVFGIYTLSSSGGNLSQVCLSATNSSISATATAVSMAWSGGGSNEISNVCYLPAGDYGLIGSSDSTTVKIMSYQNAGNSVVQALSSHNAWYFGSATSAIGSGTGSGVTLPATIATGKFAASQGVYAWSLER